MKRIFSAFLSLCIIMTGVMARPLQVRAVVIDGYIQYSPNGLNTTTKQENVSGVYQGNSISDFLKASPVSQITIDEDKINDMRNNIQGRLLFNTNDPRYTGLGFVNMYEMDANNEPKYQRNDGKNVFSELKAEQMGSSFFVFNQQEALKAGKSLSRTELNQFDGDLVEYVFEGAATLEDGSPADVIFTYSNLRIALQTQTPEGNDDNRQPITEAQLNNIMHLTIVNGNQAQVFGTSIKSIDPVSGSVTLEKSNISYRQRYGIQIDVNIRVVDPATQKTVPGLFYFRVADLDVSRMANDQKGFSGLTNNSGVDEEGTAINRYSEQIKLKSGFETEDYSIYLPGGVESSTDNLQGKGIGSNLYNKDNINNGNNGRNHEGYKCTISKTNDGGYLVQPNQSDYAYNHAGTLYSGFVAVANNTDGGVNLRLWSAGAGSHPVETYLLAGFGKRNGGIGQNILFKKVKSISETGGTIQTSTKLNTNGQLNDGGQIVGQGTLSVHTGAEVGYTMTAESPGWGLDQVWVNQAQNEDLTLTTNDFSLSVKSMVETTETTDPNTGIRQYYYIFNTATGTNVTQNKSIHVTWRRVAYTDLYVTDPSLPQEVQNEMPKSNTWTPENTTRDVTPIEPSRKTVQVGDIIYTFMGYDKTTDTINNADVTFKANWVATPANVPQPQPAPAPAATPTSAGGGSTPPPATPVPEDALPALQVPSTETSGGTTADGGTGLTIEQGQASPLAITPVLPEGVVAGGFRRVEVNGVVQPAELYHVNGDTVTLFPALLNTLPVGTHTIRLVYDNLWTEAVATVLGATRARVMNSPPTGDGNTALIYALIGIQAASAGGVALLLKRRRRS